MLAAATLLFLIALPIVNCRRLDTFNIEELGEYFSAKDYDQGKRDNGMNQEINACPEHCVGNFTTREVCTMLTSALSGRLGENPKEDICKTTSNCACHCNTIKHSLINSKCNECLVSPDGQHPCKK